MANLRPILLMGLLVLAYLMWVEWQKDYGPKTPVQSATDVSNSISQTQDVESPQDMSVPGLGDLPSVESDPSGIEQGVAKQAVMTGDSALLKVTTDVFEVGIDLVGGTIVSARLLDYPLEAGISEIKA